ATQTWWKFSICVTLQPWPTFANGSAVIHWTYTSPVCGSSSMPLGTVLQNEFANAIAFCAKTSADGPNVCPPSLDAATQIWLIVKSWSLMYTWSCAALTVLGYTASHGRSMSDGLVAA